MRRTNTDKLARLAAALCATVACMLVAAGPALAAADDSVGFAVTPLRFDVETGPGMSTSHSITITNTDDVATTYSFSKEDFEGDKDDPDASPVLLGGKFESAISGFEWLSVPEPVTIAPGDSKTVTAKVDVPAGASGGHYVALIVSSAPQAAGSVIAQSRIAVLFMVNAGGVPPPDIIITEIQEVGPGRVVTEYINGGKTATTNTTGVLERNPVGPGPTTRIKGKCTQDVLPGAAGTCEFVDEEGEGEGKGTGEVDPGLLPVGPVEESVSIVADAGDSEGTAARGELPTEWAGAWSSLLLPLVGVALFVLYFLFLRRRRKDGEDGEDSGLDFVTDGPE